MKNGHEILLSENMFLSHRVPISSKLLKKAGEPNELQFYFESAWLRGKKEEAENGGPLGLCELSLVSSSQLSFVRSLVRVVADFFFLCSSTLQGMGTPPVCM